MWLLWLFLCRLFLNCFEDEESNDDDDDDDDDHQPQQHTQDIKLQTDEDVDMEEMEDLPHDEQG